MSEADYILRMIQQFGAFLARVIFRIQSGDLSEARLDVERASGQFLGLPWDLVLGLSEQALENMLAVDGERYPEKAFAAAQLFACEGKIRDADESVEAKVLYLRSLRLLLRAFPRMDDEVKNEATAAIDQTLKVLLPLPPKMCELLVAHFECQGEYSKAEDLLFALAPHEPEDALRIGLAFYERILPRTDEELGRGNLPRSEVEEGILDLRMKCIIAAQSDDATEVSTKLSDC